MTDEEVLERMKLVVGDDYFDWYLEILDDVIVLFMLLCIMVLF
jgi:hypothetical protein